MIGVRAVADVMRTLDKLSIRKEYHEALARQGVSLDSIVGGIKNIADNSEADITRLKALQTLLRSIGLERYEDVEDISGRGWEEALLAAERGERKELTSGSDESIEVGEYEVIHPVVPQSVKDRIEKEHKLGKNLYED